MANPIKLFITDVDGVLTDGGMYYTESGDEFKKFYVQDGMGLVILKELGVKTAIITAESLNLVSRRAEKLKIDYLYLGAKDKLKLAKEICEKEGMTLANVAYVGDDVNDLELLKNVGWAACPTNAIKSVKNIPGITHLTKQGGDGAVREFIELIFPELS